MPRPQRDPDRRRDDRSSPNGRAGGRDGGAGRRGSDQGGGQQGRGWDAGGRDAGGRGAGGRGAGGRDGGGRDGGGRGAGRRDANGRQRSERDPSRPSWEPRERPSRWQRQSDRAQDGRFDDRGAYGRPVDRDAGDDRRGGDDRGRGRPAAGGQRGRGQRDRDERRAEGGRQGQRDQGGAPRGDRRPDASADRSHQGGRFGRDDRRQGGRDEQRSLEGRSYRDERVRRDAQHGSSDRPRREVPPRDDRGRDDRGRDDRGRGRDGGRGPARDDRRHDERSRDAGRPGERRTPDEQPRRDSVYYPTRDAQPKPGEDVVHGRLDATVVAADVDGVDFATLGLGAGIVGALAGLGAVTPFPIQAAAIPEAMAGRDVLGRGRTGSGKTIAFAAPMVEHLLRTRPPEGRKVGRPPRAIILAPTRELAMQIDQVVQSIARAVGIFTTTVVGGVRQGPQVRALERGVDILVGTPGRIEDLVEQRYLDLGRVEIAVLDEADHMAELGFLEPVQRLLRRTRPDSQKLLFSATLDKEVAALAKEFLRDPAVLEVAGEDQASSTIEHHVLVVDRYDKDAVLEQLVRAPGPVVVFARTRIYAERLALQFEASGIRAVSLHGDLNQHRRQRNLDLLQRGKVDVLVATDVAARGIHIDDVPLVVQADPPDEHKAYLHRSGRTGRAGRTGTVVTVIAPSRRTKMQELLDRAEIVAAMIPVAPGDDVLGTIGVVADPSAADPAPESESEVASADHD